MLSPDEAELEHLYGPLARNREYNPGDRISYRLAGNPAHMPVGLYGCAKPRMRSA